MMVPAPIMPRFEHMQEAERADALDDDGRAGAEAFPAHGVMLFGLVEVVVQVMSSDMTAMRGSMSSGTLNTKASLRT